MKTSSLESLCMLCNFRVVPGLGYFISIVRGKYALQNFKVHPHLPKGRLSYRNVFFEATRSIHDNKNYSS